MKNRKEKKIKALKSACRTILPLMFDYACRTGELNHAQYKLAQEHLKNCPECSKTARNMKSVVGILRKASGTSNATPPARLTKGRRQRILKLCS